MIRETRLFTEKRPSRRLAVEAAQNSHAFDQIRDDHAENHQGDGKDYVAIEARIHALVQFRPPAIQVDHQHAIRQQRQQPS